MKDADARARTRFVLPDPRAAGLRDLRPVLDDAVLLLLMFLFADEVQRVVQGGDGGFERRLRFAPLDAQAVDFPFDRLDGCID